jgi:3'-phosphoadenosine 5'-phosphosulfate sulfotransferase (PAPS reductase)/FAD synthetase
MNGQKEPLVVSFGAGVNSTAMLIEMRRRGMRPDLVLFADTGGEKPETYEHLEKMNRWCKDAQFPEITVVRYEPRRVVPNP